jgi:ADP-dependent NAD(P)H-hydrate dehydratase / NAD(P)H-hydrate epimerase
VTELLTAAQMRAIETAAIESGSVTGLELMERAGRGVVDAVLEAWPELAATSHRAVVLCGPGNNGGDGFVVARLLKERGWEVDVFLHGDADRLPPDARANYDRWSAIGKVRPAGSVGDEDDLAALAPGLLVDALFGTGLARPCPGEVAAFLEFSRRANTRVDGYFGTVAIDVPSGLCSDSGRVIAPADGERPASRWAIKSDLTVTFHMRKRGHVLSDGAETCGRVVVKDIGLRPGSTAAPQSLASDCIVMTGSLSPLTAKRHPGHKFTHGHALVLGGPPGKGGAARLAARGALRIGAGLVTLGCPPAALKENAAQLTAIMLRPLREVTDLIEFLADGRINAICLGPGLGRGERAQQMVTAVLAAERATVLDADALTVHEDDPASLFLQLHETCVLTPHGGEFRRLFPDIAARLDAPATTGPAFSKVDATREAAARAGCTVLFKGADTVIADASGRCAVNPSVYDRAAPWLATAGSGDVLAGFITGLLARGLGPMAAAATAARLHTECALSFGPGLIAEDLPEELPKVFRALGL